MRKTQPKTKKKRTHFQYLCSKIPRSLWISGTPSPLKKEKNRKHPKEFMIWECEREWGGERGGDPIIWWGKLQRSKKQNMLQRSGGNGGWVNLEGPTDIGVSILVRNKKQHWRQTTTSLSLSLLPLFYSFKLHPLAVNFWGFFLDTTIVLICCNMNHSDFLCFLQTRHASQI